MEPALHVALSAQVALQKRLDTIAQNIANMTTAGYRADGVSFEAHLSGAGEAAVAFASAGETYIIRDAGQLAPTGNPLDVAVQGDAWFAFATSEGPVFTRDGRMRMTENGDLETLSGHKVVDAGFAPIQIDPNGGPPVIARDGMITQGGVQLGAIGLFRIDPAAQLVRFENSGVIPSVAAEPVLDFVANGMVQGFSEGSNVNPILEINKLIEVSRAFDSAISMVGQSDTTMRDMIKTLGGAS
jgi:flagellar basal-body rod protein FlgF